MLGSGLASLPGCMGFLGVWFRWYRRRLLNHRLMAFKPPAWHPPSVAIIPIGLVSALHPHFNAVNFLARRDEKEVTVFAAEGHVASPTFRDRDVRQLLSGFVEHSHATAREINVPLGVNR